MTLLFTLASASWLQAQNGVSLVSTGAVWKYLDDGTQPDLVLWTDRFFDDSAWLSGPAELGYGDGDEATVVQSNRLDQTRITTTYFRHTFDIPDISGYSNVLVRLRRDDGAIVYLNGTEVFRSNMPDDPIDSLTFASGNAADNGNQIFPRLVTSPVLFNGPNVLAVEVHQSSLTSSDVTFDLALLANVVPAPPTVSITSPTNNAVFFTPVNITINVTASDPDNPITVEFFEGLNKLGEDATGPYTLIWSNVPPGAYSLRARATDTGGASTDSAVVNITVISSGEFLISTNSTWRYLDDGSDQNASIFWTSPFYDDSFWPSGLAQLGFGDGGEATVIQSNRVDLTRITTYYFRQTFNLADASVYTNLIVRLLRDDGAVVYLNDTEIFRSNMPTGEVNYLTLALVATPDENTFFQRAVNPALLVSGANTLAVEVHQNATDSSDISFDAALIGNVPAGPPTVSITAPANNSTFPPGNITINATASDPDGHVSLVEFFSNNTKVGEDATSPYSAVWTNPPAGNYALTARARDDRGNMTTSAPVNITVVAGVVATFRYTTGGYTNMLDTDVRFGAPDTSFGTNNAATADGDVTAGGDVDPAHALLRFGDVFGPGTNQVPVGANIVLATLSFRTQNGSVDTVSVHRVLIQWDEDSTWNTLTDGISANDVEALATPDRLFQNNTADSTVNVDVTPTVQAWANGAANWGWVFLPTGNDGYQLSTSEFATPQARRPTLTITYAAEVRPRFSYQIVGGQLQLSWNNGSGYTLQQATNVTGPWTTAASQANPQLVSMTGTARFFRLSNP